MAPRIGIFGGTFDPPHLGHLILASEAVSQLSLTRLLWVLAAVPPHKIGEPISPVDGRLTMLRLALQGEPLFEISRVDIDRPGPHYTIDTLGLLRAGHPGSDLILVIGGDSLHDLPQWHRPAEVIAACDEIGVMRRPGDAIDLSALLAELPGLAGKVHYIDAPLLEISSHEIRERVRAGQPFRYFLPAPVYQFVNEQRLYASA